MQSSVLGCVDGNGNEADTLGLGQIVALIMLNSELTGGAANLFDCLLILLDGF